MMEIVNIGIMILALFPILQFIFGFLEGDKTLMFFSLWNGVILLGVLLISPKQGVK